MAEAFLGVLLVGDPARFEVFRHELAAHPAVGNVAVVALGERAYPAFQAGGDGPVNTVFVDPAAGEPGAAARFVRTVREAHPEVALVVRARRGEPVAHHFHYDPAGADLLQVVAQCQNWQLRRRVTGTPHYDYDVALSFADADRAFADELAAVLSERDVRVLADDYEKSALWAGPLYTELHSIYAERSRFSIVLVSRAYTQQVCTGRAWQTVQARVREARGRDHVLPIRLDDAELPGPAPRRASLRGDLGAAAIAEIFVRKLAGR